MLAYTFSLKVPSLKLDLSDLEEGFVGQTLQSNVAFTVLGLEKKTVLLQLDTVSPLSILQTSLQPGSQSSTGRQKHIRGQVGLGVGYGDSAL